MRLTYSTHLEAHDRETVFQWHERPGALQRLTPPWANVDFLETSQGVKDGARVELRVHQGPTSWRWEVEHSDYIYPKQFRDVQVSGPLKHWDHLLKFKPHDKQGTVVIDEVEVEPPLGIAGAAVGPGFVKRELGRLYAFRHRRLETDLARHAEHADKPRLTVAVTGSSGLVGSNLCHFLTTGGHRVIRLVRDSRQVDAEDAIYWNPGTGEIDAEGLAAADAVVHLAGTSIAAGRWTEARKKQIKQSRVRGTELLVRTLAELGDDAPKTLVSASAIGFYGNRGPDIVDERELPGKGFLAEVCRAWEGATKPAERAGIRVALARTGVALSPAGGALGQMLLPFKFGAGGRLGSGKQYVSWVDLDDVVAALHHILFDDSLDGPINITSPHPVTNSTFTSALGRALGRPTVVPIPSLAIKGAFGEMGTELLLWGQRVKPTRLEASGFRWDYEGINESLEFQLGRVEAKASS